MLYHLIDSGEYDLASKSLEAGAEPELWTDNRGLGALSMAALRSHSGATTIIKQLVQNGANVNAEDAKGRTPLFHAVDSAKAYNGQGLLSGDVVQTLLSLGADKEHRDRFGHRAADTLPLSLEVWCNERRKTTLHLGTD